MAKAATKKKATTKAKATPNEAPKIIAAKGGLTAPQLLAETLFTMEDELRISKKQAKDFSDSLIAVIEKTLQEGEPVNLFGLVKLSPRLHTKGERMVREEFGNPESKLVKKKYPAKVSVKATIFKRVKDALPTANKLAKSIG